MDRFGNSTFYTVYSIFLILDGCYSSTSIIPSYTGKQHLNLVIKWPETNIGGLAVVNCPCGSETNNEEQLHLQATRYCGGDFTNGALWDAPDVIQCNFSDLAREICHLRNVIYIIKYS